MSHNRKNCVLKKKPDAVYFVSASWRANCFTERCCWELNGAVSVGCKNHLHVEWWSGRPNRAEALKPVTLMGILVSYRRSFSCDVRIPQTYVMVKTTCHWEIKPLDILLNTFYIRVCLFYGNDVIGETDVSHGQFLISLTYNIPLFTVVK